MRIRIGSHAFTLVEVLITTLLTLILCLLITGGLLFVRGAQKYARERAGALRAATRLIEEARAKPFEDLIPVVDRPVTIDDSRTPTDTTDDLVGRGNLTLYHINEVGDPETVYSTVGLGYIQVEAMVNWFPATARTENSNAEKNVTIVTQFAP
jgi:type II secretory pathway pseudopilin PulG